MQNKLKRVQWPIIVCAINIIILSALALPGFAANWSETFSGSIPSSWLIRAGTSMTYASSPTHTAGTGSAYRSAGQTSHHWRLTGSRPSYAGEATAWLYCLQDYALVGTSQSRGSYRDVLMLSSYDWLDGMLAVGLYSPSGVQQYSIWHNPGSGLIWENIGSRGQHPSARGVFDWVSFKAICTDNNNCYFETKDTWVTRSKNVTRTAANINAGIWRVAIGLHYSSADPCNWDDITWTGYAPATPTGIAATALSTSQIKWTANAGTNNNQYGFDLMDGGTRKVAGSETTRQTSADLTETGLSPNTSYTRSIRAWNGDINSTNSTTLVRYTLQNTPTTPTFTSITTSSFTVNTTGPVNLTTGSSGVVFHDGNADLSKVTQNYVDITGLTANTPYTYKAKAYNAEGAVTDYSATATKYTLSVAPTAGTITANTTTPCQDGDVVWTNTAGWGAGKVEYYRYAWDQSAAHTWTDTETKWTSGTLTLSPTAAGTWYLHIKGYNGNDVGNGTYDYSVTATATFSIGSISGGGGTFCGAADPAQMTYSGGSGGGALSYQWYSKEGVSSPTISDTLITGATGASYDPPAGLNTTTTYNVLVTPTCGTAAFTSTPVTVTVNPLPAVPTGASTNAICGSGDVDFSATPDSGCTLKWYDAASGGNAVSTANPYTESLSATKTYYAASVSTAGCESATRLAVTGTVHSLPNTPANPSATPSTIGPNGSSALFATVGQGEEVVWYSGSCGGTVVTSPVSPVVTTTYYAKAKNSTTGCLSASCAQVTVTYVPDDEGPELTNVSVTCSKIGEAPTYNFLKGTVTVEAEAADDSGVGSVVFVIDDSQTPITMTLDQNTGKYVGTCTIDEDWTNGQHSIKVIAKDIYNNQSDETKSFPVNKNEIEGMVGWESAEDKACTRAVTFVINGTITKTLSLNFTNGKAYYDFVDVPEITSISAKTAWHLRSRRTVTMTKGQAEVDFLGSKVLRGGDLATPGYPMGDNVVNALDYAVLRSNWGYGAAGDITGDGYTDNSDYLVMIKYLYVKGDQP